VVDRDLPAGYPDALLLATLPYNSINEREIGTTFGLRAQDAIGWNPRSFHFLSSASDFRDAQQWFRQMVARGVNATSTGSSGDQNKAMAQLLQLQGRASSGQFRIVDARIVPGIADPQPFARGWALAASRMQYEVVPALPGESTQRGRLAWMRFALTLWLPARWKVPAQWHAVPGPCQE
jgi:hypothetical protein